MCANLRKSYLFFPRRVDPGGIWESFRIYCKFLPWQYVWFGPRVLGCGFTRPPPGFLGTFFFRSGGIPNYTFSCGLGRGGQLKVYVDVHLQLGDGFNFFYFHPLGKIPSYFSDGLKPATRHSYSTPQEMKPARIMWSLTGHPCFPIVYECMKERWNARRSHVG